MQNAFFFQLHIFSDAAAGGERMLLGSTAAAASVGSIYRSNYSRYVGIIYKRQTPNVVNVVSVSCA